MKYFRIVFIISGIYLIEHKVTSFQAEKIVGGNLARVGQFKYQVSVQRNGEPKCGGGILHNSFVVTAAHCVIDVKTGEFHKSQLTIVAAAIDLQNLDSMAVTIQVVMIFIPKDFKSNIERSSKKSYMVGDIAILKLKQDLKLQLSSNLNKLQINEIILYEDQILVITGQGYYKMTQVKNPVTGDYNEQGQLDGRLRFANASIVSHKMCKKKYKYYNEVSSICARVIQRSVDYPEGTCSGDSGSPLVLNDDVLVGLLSFGTARCIENEEPSVYTNALHYWWFIDSVLKGLTHPDVRFAVWKSTKICFGKQEFVEE